MPTSRTETSPDDWKQKYRDAVTELDAKEGQWRHEQTELHKNLLRLCFAYTGVDDGLDGQLKELQRSLKKNPDPSSRSKLINEIADEVARIGGEKANQAPPASGPSLLQSLIDGLKLPGTDLTEIKLIRSRLERADDAELRRSVQYLTELINEAAGSTAGGAAADPHDTFSEFLGKLNVPAPLGEKFAALHQRSNEIQTDLDRLTVIDDTIALLSEGLKTNDSSADSAAKATEIVRELIEWMTLPAQVKEQLAAIQAQLDNAEEESNLSGILRDLGHTVSRFHGNLMSELTDIEYYLKNTAIRLKELQLGVEEAFNDQRESFDEQQNLDAGIEDKVVSIATQLADEHDLGKIKHFIDDGLKDIRAQMRDHLKRNQERVAIGEKRMRALTERLTKMSAESSKLRDQVQRERDRAQRDALTGVPNRAAYDERIAAEVARQERHGRKVSLAVIDIDRFKGVNDSLGHKAGDKVLKNVAEICSTNVRTSDFIARYGGEEFALILPETNLDQAYLVAEKLRADIEDKRFFYNQRRVPITVSIGVAELGIGETADALFLRADRALYQAKESGRNRSVKG